MTRTSTRALADEPRFLTVEELAEMLRVEVRTVYSWVSKGNVPFRKAGRRTVFLLDEILEWTAGSGNHQSGARLYTVDRNRIVASLEAAPRKGDK